MGTPVTIENSLIDYDELAKRLAVKKTTAKRWVSARLITPAISHRQCVRFHWPSVVGELLQKRHHAYKK